MEQTRFILITILFILVGEGVLLLPARAAPPNRVESVSELWHDISLGPSLVDWFNRVARSADIARVDHVERVDLLDRVTVGRKLVVFKSVAEAERFIPVIADKVDIVGYNLEHGAANPSDEQADPVGSARRMRALADQYGLILAFGPDHDFALSNGVTIAPYVDIFVLQIQRAQTEPDKVQDFVLPLIPQLRQANPDIEISVQVRTEGDVVAIVDLIDTMKESLDGISILTSPETVDVAKALVVELQTRILSSTNSARPSTKAGNNSAAMPTNDPMLPMIETGTPLVIERMGLFWIITMASVLVIGAGGILAAFYIRKR